MSSDERLDFVPFFSFFFEFWRARWWYFESIRIESRFRQKFHSRLLGGKDFQRFFFFFLFFFFLIQIVGKTLESHVFFSSFFFQHLDNFLKSWPIKNLLALNTNEISLAGAKLSPLLGFLKFFPISEEIKSEKEGKEKKRKEGKKR